MMIDDILYILKNSPARLKFFSITKKSVTLYLTSMFIIAISFYIYTIRIIYPNILTSEHQKIEAISNLVKDDIAISLSFNTKKALDEIKSKLLKDKNVLDVYIKGEEIGTKKPKLKFKSDEKIIFFEDKNYFTKYTLLSNEFENLGYFVLFYSANEYIKNLKNYNKFLQYIFLEMLILLFIFTISQKLMLLPFTKLSNILKNIDFNKRTETKMPKVNDNDERKELIETTDIMLHKINEYIDKLSILNNFLELKVQERTYKLKETLEHLEKAKDEAERANKIKSEFLANVTHEIRTPINAIIGFTELLEADITTQCDKNYLSSIKVASTNLLTLINDILDLSKIEANRMSLKLESVDIYKIFKEIKDIFTSKIEQKNLNFIVEIDKNTPKELLLDNTKIRQIIFNLVGNAIKFTNNGFVKLSLKVIENRGDKIDLILSIQDSGIGIKRDEMERVFKPFVQQSNQMNSYGGTGLGLSITKRLVEMMDGDIIPHSKVGVGSTFKIILKNIKILSIKKSHIDNINIKPKAITLSKEVLDNIEEVLNKLENEFQSEKEEVSKSGNIVKIEKFTNKLLIFAKNNKIEVIEEFANSLIKDCKNFDIANVKSKLIGYDLLIKELKNIKDSSVK